jgi:hypothetical protein
VFAVIAARVRPVPAAFEHSSSNGSERGGAREALSFLPCLLFPDLDCHQNTLNGQECCLLLVCNNLNYTLFR